MDLVIWCCQLNQLFSTNQLFHCQLFSNAVYLEPALHTPQNTKGDSSCKILGTPLCSKLVRIQVRKDHQQTSILHSHYVKASKADIFTKLVLHLPKSLGIRLLASHLENCRTPHSNNRETSLCFIFPSSSACFSNLRYVFKSVILGTWDLNMHQEKKMYSKHLKGQLWPRVCNVFV